MAATRKLQGVKMREMKGEIDRCLKKVTEGVETFEDIWQKVHNATNSNQKEKYEADLKKEIKKLQRLRDQIKSWIASGEIKDKSTLLDYRKLIETQMERFKVVERETKTKAYSKEGLGAAQKLDPAQKEREEVSNWLANSIDALNLQLDTFESEIESLLAGKKKRLDKDKQDRMDELKAKLEKHRYHIRKLETLLRMLDNMSVEVDTIKRIKDDVEYYIESSQEPDFEENEYIYDDIIGLDEVELSGVGIPSSATTDSNNSNETGGTPTSTNSGTSPIPSPPLSSTMHNHSSDSSTDMDKKTKPVKPTAVRPLLNSQGSIPTTGSTTVIKMSLLSSSTPSKPIPMTSSHSSPSATINHIATSNAGNFATVAASHINSQVIHSTSSKTSSHGSENGLLSSSSTSSVASNVPPTIMQQHNNPPPLQPSHILLNQQSQNHNSETEMTTPIPSSSSPPSPVSSRSSPLPANSCSPVPSATNGLISKIPDGMSSLKSIAQQVIVRAGIEIPPSEPTRNLFDTTKVSNATSEAHIPPLLGVAPLGPVPLQKEHQLQFQMMEAAYYHMPHPSDSERLRSYLPRNLCKTPPYYQQVQLPHSDTVEFFQRLSTETLFFIFYYMEGSKGQYLAAKALKKQSWRFHTKYMMWFQRHEEPKVINEEYEQGTYIYFDYEKWGQRKKEGFTFEYKYLEDRDLN
ncbi:CCR4-NOT transcription complex subunit 3 isoform X3 [Neodiprion pinetum]|uniref:CCR4-NOT transcription complex subunit 3 isoform X3 n=1 Tax=Neodiprion lecontei TaxID=441921 RepID=A0ABM3FK34_NEOLC|nr:CCR4-NOT transcription complex subunit 3 isoform X3 [Neodiprion fabricii]XP_046410277.1 CCR4-NOT transcription complex subunit 3 isoform X3 [Neodiprion fabricii]XP_046469277.1 CCR4-NOT transcription complex subunit 3 isoform X3 [Neodiprion pinetum]XP_046469278.1 CCR4-NOT transcription complex subunit 3 isoform X3 [Neodiprion pinetum]XP_046588387.1 CCR4-NOT transcription complex subunit 3 isoform X3 [Neodiprion lecontei]XP_046588388.1 CCR4-NOT transcription complex subunit 3 isoform X3 [Neod